MSILDLWLILNGLRLTVRVKAESHSRVAEGTTEHTALFSGLCPRVALATAALALLAVVDAVGTLTRRRILPSSASAIDVPVFPMSTTMQVISGYFQ
jgi:hypothetical protein